MIEYAARDAASGVIDALINATWKARSPATGYHAEVRYTVNHVVLHHLMALAANEQASAQVRAVASYKLDALKGWLRAGTTEKAFYARQQIERFQRDPKLIPVPRPAQPPLVQSVGME